MVYSDPMETHSMHPFTLTTSKEKKYYERLHISDYLALSDMEKLILHQVTKRLSITLTAY